MVIRNNVSLSNANPRIKLGSVKSANSAKKLSSGFKINKAGDNSSGLAISEKLRKYLGGLMQASSNAQDGISTVQIADGALSGVSDNLQRMNELSIRAANGFMSSSDRAALQKEMDQLVNEVDRVSSTTKFNETYLLKGNRADGGASYNTALGSLQGKVSQLADPAQAAAFKNSGSVSLDITRMGRQDGITGDINAALAALGADSGLGNTTINSASMVSANTGTGGSEVKYLSLDSVDAKNVFKEWGTSGDIASYINKQASNAKPGDALYNVRAFANMDELRSQLKSDLGGDISTISESANSLDIKAFSDANSGNLNLQVGADASRANSAGVSLSSMSARSLGLNGLSISGNDPTNALKAIDTISSALSRVSSQRSGLGATQNRLESTVRNLGNVYENTTASESRIRDTDYGKELISNSQDKILQQARLSLMAQANQNYGGVLRLLQ